ncbi:MAG: hypothetical protein IJ770_03710 [Alphaproteobacteria bacterium]|nr:hypothetical protein [Alphaproteobacteria bacterium]
MTDKTYPLTYEIIEQLFQNSVCLSYNPIEPMSAFQYTMKLKKDYEKQYDIKKLRLCSKNAKLWISNFTPKFHYFSDGTLIYDFLTQNQSPLLKSIMRLLKLHGLAVNKIYAPKDKLETFTYNRFMRYISEQALLKYPYTADLYVEPFPNKENFVRECFYADNVLLTASKAENVDPDCRRFMALFADGKYFVSEDYATHLGTKNYGKIMKFEDEHRSYIYLHREIVPQEYIDALYEKAQEYDWYVSAQDVMMNQHKQMSFEAVEKMSAYVENLFKDRVCLSVVNPSIEYPNLSPEVRKYALFSDGLVVSVYSLEVDEFLSKDLHQIYPNMNFRGERVPLSYIKEIYRRLPEFQKGAAEIYIEMLKQKARKLKRMLEIPHHEALDTASQMAGWQNWKNVKIEDEMHARGLIDAEKWRKKMAVERNQENPLMWEYEHWQMRQKHLKKQ